MPIICLTVIVGAYTIFHFSFYLAVEYSHVIRIFFCGTLYSFKARLNCSIVILPQFAENGAFMFQLPRMLETDAVARYYGLGKGTAVKVKYDSEITGNHVTYRCIF
jgi:hypothetical protein